MKNRIIWLYPRFTTWMGGSRFVFEVLSLLKQQYDVLLVVQREKRQITDELRAGGIDVLCLDTPSFTEVRFWLMLDRIIRDNERRLRNILSRGDILISSMFPMNVLARRFEYPHIQIIYEPFALFYNRAFQKNLGLSTCVFFRAASALFADKDIQSVNKADVVLTLSEYERANSLRVYGRDSHVTYEGVDTDHFRPRVEREISRKYEGFNIVFHSTAYDPYKGTDLLIKAIPLVIEECPNTRILISHTRVSKKKLHGYLKYLEDHSALAHVEFLGFLDYAVLPAYYTLADIYVEPGFGRSMSLSSKEANACGTPSLRGDTGTEDTIDGVTGILTSSRDETQLAENIIKLLKNTPLRERLGENARKHVLEQYTWGAVVNRIDSHIERFI